jgi:PIN domain nuclease of toxin-antitoxin system
LRFLLDTHCWLWLQTATERFSGATLDLLSDTRNELLLSAASSWEMAIKYQLGKLPLPAPPEEYVPSRMQVSGTSALPVLHIHALRVGTLPPLHRDPFDRLIIAQALHERITVVTADQVFERYRVQVQRP